MGYESALHLVGVQVAHHRLRAVRGAIRNRKKHADESLQFFLANLVVDSNGFLEMRAAKDGSDPYEPVDGEKGIPAKFGKWYGDQIIARWLSRYAVKGGRIVFHSVEADGEAWGWEFNGRGQMRRLTLRSLGKWS